MRDEDFPSFAERAGELFYEAMDTLKGMISRPAFSREEEAVADYLQQIWQADRQPIHRKGNNIWITAPGFDKEKPCLLLNSHIDTVKPVAGWTKGPFTPEEDDADRLFGLGSNDAGASLVSLYAAFRYLSTKEQPYNLLFLASAEEEISGKDGIESALKELPPICFAVVGEPTGMQPAIAEKGLMVLDCIAMGKAGHAARSEGVNAITLAMKDIEWFHTWQFPEKSELLGPVKMSVTLIQAGTQHNVIPDRCAFTVDIRTNEFYTNAYLFQQVKEHVQSEVKARSFRLNSSHTGKEHPFVQRAVMMGKQPFGSPTLSDQALMPFPSVKIGPGDSARSHSADEFIALPEIREAIETYVRLLDGLTIN
jgi:acetylornithine deacetylase